MICIPERHSAQYTLSICAGIFNVVVRQMCGIVVGSLDVSFKMELPQIIECNDIPNDRQEIPTPEVVDHFKHLGGVTIRPLNKKVDILLLIGREVPDVHHGLEQRIGPKTVLFAQRLRSGWAIVVNVCLGVIQIPSTFEGVNKTTVLSRRGPTVFEPYDQHIAVCAQSFSEDRLAQDVFA